VSPRTSHPNFPSRNAAAVPLFHPPGGWHASWGWRCPRKGPPFLRRPRPSTPAARFRPALGARRTRRALEVIPARAAVAGVRTAERPRPEEVSRDRCQQKRDPERNECRSTSICSGRPNPAKPPTEWVLAGLPSESTRKVRKAVVCSSAGNDEVTCSCRDRELLPIDAHDVCEDPPLTRDIHPRDQQRQHQPDDRKPLPHAAPFPHSGHVEVGTPFRSYPHARQWPGRCRRNGRGQRKYIGIAMSRSGAHRGIIT
jgi:hypothetical protein